MSSSGLRKMKVVEEVLEVKEVYATRMALSDINKWQKELDALKEAELKEILQAKKIISDKFNGLRKPYYEQRAAVVERIPNFWGNVIAHHPKISKLVDEGEEESLRFLKKLEVEEFESGFRINFFFDENPFFDNRELIKHLQLGKNAEPKSSCTVIKCKENMDLSKKLDDTKLGKVKKTFFSWFADTQDPTTDDIAEVIKKDLWPNPLQYYKTGDEDVSILTAKGKGLGAIAALEEKGTVGSAELSWDNLPSVILREIVGHLVWGCSRYTNKKPLLNLRLANTHWRDELDSCLELERLRSWTRLELKIDSLDRSPTNLATINGVPTDVDNINGYGTNLVFCPTKVVELSEDGRNPFPAKSLTLSGSLIWSDDDHLDNSMTLQLMLPDLREGETVMKWDNLFRCSGNHLTSLVLIRLRLTPGTLEEILENTPNLKALSLNEVYIDKDDDSDDDSGSDADDSMPMLSTRVLPALRHIRLTHYNGDADLRKWILGPYRHQLETLKIDFIVTGMELGEGNAEFARLKRLTVWSVKTFNFLLEHEKFPKLTSLTLTDDARKPSHWKSRLEDLRFHLAHFAGKLVELHLDLHYRSYSTSIKEKKPGAKGDVFHFGGNQYLNEFRWSTSGVIFSELKTFSIRISMIVEEEEAVREMLRCVPNLEILNLILVPEIERTSVSEAVLEIGRQVFWTVFRWEWTQCPKMRKITLWNYDADDFEKVILTEHMTR